ncbi:hypothetical protein [Kitasatospora sp. A2-31]|uniref:hypothetical protein n=1 Tax=Kitasatospora sp. A2-31 TaxID=2916414 RepID=UPI001EEB8ADB|nr:hypothetical protein [Kitasatospora sp. A2-31]MCG6495901.1 hypothetical protein [Kitasatospora sp. A2-31]
MHPGAAFDRRLQAGPANFPLTVRCGESSWTELADRLAAFRAHRFVLVGDAAAPAEYVARIHALAAARAPCTRVTLRSDAAPAPSPFPEPPPSPECPEPSPGSTADPSGPRGTSDSAAPESRTVVIAVGGEQACRVPADLRLPTTLAAACGPALALLPPPAGARTPPARTAPALVWARSDLLAARPAAETRAGMVTVIRHVLAVCPAQYEALAAVLRPDARYTPHAVAACLALCADARAALVGFDPFETGPALALDYGRRLGEAVRAAADAAGRAVPAPGDAEALGLLLAAEIAVGLGLLDGSAAWAHRELLARNGSTSTLPGGDDPLAAPALDAVGACSDVVGAGLLADAVTVAARPGLLLLADLGYPHCVRGRLLTQVDPGVLRAAVRGAAPTALPQTRRPVAEPQPAAA